MSTYAVIGGVLREVAPSSPVIGGVLRQATADYAVVGGVLRQVWVGLPAPGHALEDYTWEEIAQVAAAGRAREYWAAGNTKTTIINGASYLMQIVDFDHDDLADADAMYGTGYNRGSGKAAITFMMQGLYRSTYKIYDVQPTLARWEDSTMRTAIMPSFLTVMEPDLVSAIRTVNKFTAYSGLNSTITTTQDKVFLPSASEIIGKSALSYAYPGEGTNYPVFTEDQTRIKYTYGTTTPGYWWTRSPAKNRRDMFGRVLTNGWVDLGTVYIAESVSVAFCM